MGILFTLLYFMFPLSIAIYVSKKHQISILKILLISIMPVILFISYMNIKSLFDYGLDSISFKSIIGSFVMIYLMTFVPLILSSATVLYFKKIYALSLYKLLGISAFIGTVTIFIYALFLGISLYESFEFIFIAILTGTISIGILYYFTDYKMKNKAKL